MNKKSGTYKLDKKAVEAIEAILNNDHRAICIPLKDGNYRIVEQTNTSRYKSENSTML